MARVAAIGIDSADWTLVKKLMAAGKMPNLERLAASGVEIPFHNDIVGKPEEAWTGFLFGDAPYRSGYWSNLTFDPATYRSYRQGVFTGKPFYATTSHKRLIFDVPKSGLVADMAGIQATSWGAHAASFPRASQPAGLIRELDELYGPHPAFENEYYDGWYQSDYVDQLGDALVDGSSLRLKATRHLLSLEPDWDFFLTVLSETHSGGHHFWHGVDDRHLLAHAPTADQAGKRMIDVYESADSTLGGIIESLPSDTSIVVFSVHGMKPNDSDVANNLLLPELLHRYSGGAPMLKGRDHEKWAKEGYPVVLPDPRRRLLATARDTIDSSPMSRLRQKAVSSFLLDIERSFRRISGRPPGDRPPWKSAEDLPSESDASTFGPGGVEEPATDYPNLWYQHEWPSMKAFSLPSFGEGRIRINLKGRERDGVIEKSDYRKTCDELEKLLKETVNPRTGRSIAAHVERTYESDPYDPLGPDGDLLIIWDTGVDAAAHPTLRTIGPFPMLRMSEHSNAGFAFVSSPGMTPGKRDLRPTAELPPMIMSLLNGNAVI